MSSNSPWSSGRGFVSRDDATPVIILGQRLWQHRFNGDKSIHWQDYPLSGRNFTVVGIAPAAFHSVDQILYTQFWVPLGSTDQLVPNSAPEGLARFSLAASRCPHAKPGVSRAEAAAELNTLAGRYAQGYPRPPTKATVFMSKWPVLCPRT